MDYLKTLLFSLLFAYFVAGYSQIGKYFPAIEGESLTNEVVSLPTDIHGKFTLIGMAWSKQSEEDLEGWFVPVFDLFIDKRTFIPIDYDINLYFIPMFSGIKQGAYNTVMEKSKKQLDPKLAPHVLFYKGSIKEYREKLALSDRDIPYFFVLDKQGKIVYSTSGQFTQKKLDDIEEFISQE